MGVQKELSKVRNSITLSPLAEEIRTMKIVMQIVADNIKSLEEEVEEHQRHIAAIQPTGA